MITPMTSCFKAYDIRGKIPSQLNSSIVYKIAQAYAKFLRAKKVVVGHDMRLSSRELTEALISGLSDSGVDVEDIGLCGTEEVYFATFYANFDGGIMVTASHNPKDYNGLKLVREQAKPISADTGLKQIEAMVYSDQVLPTATTKGRTVSVSYREQYIQHLLTYIEPQALKPLKVVMNPGNGCAGIVVQALQDKLPIEIIPMYFEPDGTFPNGIPNPLLSENRQPTIDVLKQHQADLAIAWDGDFDRCFFFDETGRFIEGYYLVGLLASHFLKASAQVILYDPRLIWNTIEVVESLGGKAIQTKSGHAFIKERMRQENAIYGGEMSAHHYFRDFSYCDSGMIPWLIVLEIISRQGRSLSQLVDQAIAKFPSSGEINRQVKEPAKLLQTVEAYYQDTCLDIDHTDGLSMTFEQWRFNLRVSNTEPLVRLNVESRGDVALMQAKTRELLNLIEQS